MGSDATLHTIVEVPLPYLGFCHGEKVLETGGEAGRVSIKSNQSIWPSI
jgi:hypothetical protein